MACNASVPRTVPMYEIFSEASKFRHWSDYGCCFGYTQARHRSNFCRSFPFLFFYNQIFYMIHFLTLLISLPVTFNFRFLNHNFFFPFVILYFFWLFRWFPGLHGRLNNTRELPMTKVTGFQIFPNTLWLRHVIGSYLAFLLPMPIASLLDWSYAGSLSPRPMNSLYFIQCRLLWTCTTIPTRYRK